MPSDPKFFWLQTRWFLHSTVTGTTTLSSVINPQDELDVINQLSMCKFIFCSSDSKILAWDTSILIRKVPYFVVLRKTREYFIMVLRLYHVNHWCLEAFHSTVRQYRELIDYTLIAQVSIRIVNLIIRN